MDGERNLFWCPAQSFDWYKKCGDVVVFDTTYKVNAYDMPCGIFVAIDNHGKTILFGCALLRNETTATFSWLMKNPPKTIITDQDPWMSKAIALEMPTTKHSYCIWHITSKFSSWFVALLREDYQKWEEFERSWTLIIAKYYLQENKHVHGLYNVRYFWAPTYLRDNFFGGMITNGRSESINAFIKRFVSSHVSLVDFVKQVALVVQEICQGHSHSNMVATLRPITMKTKSPLEGQALEVFTPFAFKKFQDEFSASSQYSITHVEGILCRHIFRVLLHNDCFKIPSAYLPQRWHFDTLQITTGNHEVTRDDIILKEEFETLHNDIGDSGVNVLCPPKCKTKGRPPKRREQGGKELGKKKIKSCSICKQPGHTKPTCPHKENVFSLNNMNEDATSTSPKQKKQKMMAADLGLNPIFTLKC
ncbi:protein FAR1-RELATED SEQUENCE 11-like [Beta vulgaris subsp. vulgaris]|uniref:protein FAR1-RELATED SEQUENCE 11-like n=1 Tax=Beta vulgaris subsp. vulgaris TaxID=3555 RepID=UPI002547EB62|nr:protein FAR1-RELATED SEQUENCE 11-like [Beta vulgaris subsp. vulgaris]